MCNRPTNFSLDYICQQLGLACDASNNKQLPLLFGGPMQPERGFVLHEPKGAWRSSLVIRENSVTLTTSNDIIRALAVNKGPSKVMIALGYSGWDPSKLEAEIMEDLWLVCPFNQELLYDVPYSKRWHYAGELLGVDLDQMISGTSGHA